MTTKTTPLSPAFPCVIVQDNGIEVHHAGMSLRTCIAKDLLAGALAGSLSNPGLTNQAIVKMAIEFTDELLKALSTPPKS